MSRSQSWHNSCLLAGTKGLGPRWTRKGETMNTRTNMLKIWSALVVLVLATLTIGACSASAAASRDQGGDEALLSKQVHHQLVKLPWYGVFDNLEYTIN